MESDNRSFPQQSEIIAAVVAFLPFICSMSSYNYEMVNGRVTEFSYLDIADVVLGIAAILLGLFNIRLLSIPPRHYRIALLIVVLLLSAFQIARGLGVFIDPQEFVRSQQ
jgi:hypothetical protein